MTPPLPDWIRHSCVSGYVPAHEFCPTETRLFGTESLYGDWNGRVLPLAKDFGPSCVIHGRLARGEARPYCHEPDMLTNRRLRGLADPIRGAGLLYGSALGNLLRVDGLVSGSLPNCTEALEYGTRVVAITIERIPRLERVMCLGEEAWICARDAEGLRGDWRVHRKAGRALGRLIAAYHPAARVSTAEATGPWDVLREALAVGRI